MKDVLAEVTMRKATLLNPLTASHILAFIMGAPNLLIMKDLLMMTLTIVSDLPLSVHMRSLGVS